MNRNLLVVALCIGSACMAFPVGLLVGHQMGKLSISRAQKELQDLQAARIQQLEAVIQEYISRPGVPRRRGRRGGDGLQEAIAMPFALRRFTARRCNRRLLRWAWRKPRG